MILPYQHNVVIPSYKQGFAQYANGSDQWRGLKAAWAPFLGPTGLKVFDWGPGKNHATLTAMDPATDWILSRDRWVLDFAGDDDYLETGIPSSDIANGNFTFSTWFKTDVADVGSDFVANRLITFRDSSTSSSIGFGQNTTFIGLFWDDGGGNWDVGTTVLSTATWYFATLTYDGITLRIYLNGIEENNFAEASLNTATSDTILIGCNTSTARLWDGKMDDIRLYDRAFSAQEVMHMYLNPYEMWQDDVSTIYKVIGSKVGPLALTGVGI